MLKHISGFARHPWDARVAVFSLPCCCCRCKSKCHICDRRPCQKSGLRIPKWAIAWWFCDCQSWTVYWTVARPAWSAVRDPALGSYGSLQKVTSTEGRNSSALRLLRPRIWKLNSNDNRCWKPVVSLQVDSQVLGFPDLHHFSYCKWSFHFIEDWLQLNGVLTSNHGFWAN